ncbi:lipoprotein [Rhodanobacter umsongensis]|uniref:Lipoprotein n=1 Tax=Rhodanobacter umsongensis TaxID=633153 RepID=A0ABW0JQ95_9GAMM
MRRSLLLLPLCLVVATLAGCGNKGPLTLPPARPAAVPAPAQSAAPAAAATVDTPADSQH